jgi:hypothetical protein
MGRVNQNEKIILIEEHVESVESGNVQTRK